jgi:hypothetical protein
LAICTGKDNDDQDRNNCDRCALAVGAERFRHAENRLRDNCDGNDF